MKKITFLIAILVCSSLGYAQQRLVRNGIPKSAHALKNGVTVSPAAIIFTDNMNGDNSIAGLNARGYLTYYRGTGTQAGPEWFQGDPSAFPALNGPDSGYVASDYLSVDSVNLIDNWLVLPAVNVAAGDSFSFYASAIQGSTFTDSIRVMWNAAGDSVPEAGTWVELDRFFVDTAGVWVRHAYALPDSAVAGRIAIRHTVADGGPLGNVSEYVGVDQIDVFNNVAAGNFDDCAGAISIDSAFGGAIGVVNTVGPFDNSTATTGPQDPATGWECFGEPDGGGAAPELNNTVWFSFIGDGNNYFVESANCAGVTNYIDDGDTQFALYSGACGALSPLKCNEDGPNATSTHYPAGFTFGTSPGTQYYLMVDGFSFNGAVSTGEFCLNISRVPTVTCLDSAVSTGTQSQNFTNLCVGDTLVVVDSNAVSPNSGDYFGIGWIISSADISGNTDPLNDPSLVATYTFSSPAPVASSRQFINDGTATFIIQGNTYYWTPVVFGNAIADSGVTNPVFLSDLDLDPSCTFTGTSMAVAVLIPGDPLCTVGIEDHDGSTTGLTAYPSPTADRLQVEYISNQSENSVIEVTDYTGRVVMSMNRTTASGINKVELDVRALSSGAYFLTVKNQNASQSVKFIKQ